VFPRSAVAALAAAYLALAVLVVGGTLTGIDQWSIDHLMPGLSHPGVKSTIVEALVPLLHARWNTALGIAGNVVTLPAQVVISSVLASLCCVVLWRRGRRPAAVAWATVWLAGNAVEVFFKSVLTRPLLHDHAQPLYAFESSFPSGHTLRSVLLVATVAAVWPAARRWGALWATASIALLEIDGVHVPSDIAGGLLLAVLLVLVARRVRR
jgi:membrane-associated phospholipid phosphatase